LPSIERIFEGRKVEIEEEKKEVEASQASVDCEIADLVSEF